MSRKLLDRHGKAKSRKLGVHMLTQTAFRAEAKQGARQRTIDGLRRMTEARGCSPAEAAVARRKLQQMEAAR